VESVCTYQFENANEDAAKIKEQDLEIKRLKKELKLEQARQLKQKIVI